MGNKSILMSIQPQWVAKILNGEKTIEIRKKFPAGYRGWVYVYCSKGDRNRALVKGWSYGYSYSGINEEYQGKVLFRFWCDNVYEVFAGASSLGSHRLITWTCKKMCVSLCRDSCVSQEYLDTYLGKVKGYPQGYAIHISKLEVFDKAKELSEFGITKAPQSYMFIEDTL